MRPAEAIGLRVLMLLVSLAASSISPGHAEVRAADAASRQLQPVSPETRPAFALRDLEGVDHSLEQHAGRVVLVHFFATWCEPCREELSSLNRLVEQPGSAPLSVIAVNVAEVPMRVRRFLDAAPVNFPVLFDADRAVTKAWGVSTLPTTFVLDRALAVRLFVEGDIDWSRADVLAALAEVGAGDRK